MKSLSTISLLTIFTFSFFVFKAHPSPTSNHLVIFERAINQEEQVGEYVGGRAQYQLENENKNEHTLLPGQICNLNHFGDLECVDTQQKEDAFGKRVWADINPREGINNLSPTCHLKKEHLLHAFDSAVKSGDINNLIDVYHWEGKTIKDADNIIQQLSLISSSGQWQRSYIINWTGRKSLIDDFDVFIRWKQWSEDNPVNFSFQKTLDCWFLEFVDPPPTIVTMEGERTTHRSVSQIDEDLIDSEYEENYVFIR